MTARNPLTQFVRRILTLETPYSQIHEDFSLFKDFSLLIKMTQAAGTDMDLDLGGTGTVPDPTFLSAVGQIIATRTTSAADNDEANVFPLSTSAWNASLAPSTTLTNRWEAVVQTSASSLDTSGYWAGLKLTATGVVATDNDQAYLMLDADLGTNWFAVQSVNGTDVTTDTGVAGAISTTYRLGITIGTDLKPRFYIDGSLVLTGTAFDGGEALKSGLGIIARTGGSPAARSIVPSWMRIARTRA